MGNKRKIELLAPARDFEAAVAAIDYGADAIYMGATRFGARYAAGNSVDDIAKVVDYARRFGVRVYVTLNTVLYDDELLDAARTAREVIEAGVDALIVQDMAYMEMGLEGVELHASTQTFNLTPQKVKFMQDSGFDRVILERNISLRDIKAIKEVCDVELECFVHGAICVCYSGRCYMSRTMSSRSGNRGDCSQACRLAYNLIDSSGRTLIRNKYLLSVKDLDWSGRVGELMDAGITSFKIEGRLKDRDYVKNAVSWYRRKIDEAMALRTDVERSSSGITVSDFVPDIAKTFLRGRTEYFYGGRNAGVSSPYTPKAVGESVGFVSKIDNGWFEINSKAVLSAGDGICCIVDGELIGTNVNLSQGSRIITNKELPLRLGDEIFRNYDHRFNAILESSRTRRVVDVVAKVWLGDDNIKVIYTDVDGESAEVVMQCCNGVAREPYKMKESIKFQLSRSGNTMFRVTDVVFVFKDTEDVDLMEGSQSESSNVPFLRVSELNALRREGLDELLRRRMERSPVRHYGTKQDSRQFGCDVAYASENVVNALAKRFYLESGCEDVLQGYDLRANMEGVVVMRTPFCVRRENGLCVKGKSSESLWLNQRQHRYRLDFKCEECIMEIVYEGKQR